MTGFETERAAIEGHVQANFTAAPVFFENQPFDPPKDAPYVVVTIRHSGTQPASLGPTPLRRLAGTVEAALHVPERSGTATARTLADALAAVLRRVTILPAPGVVLRLGEPTLEGGHTANGWWRATLTCVFRQDVAA